MNIQEIAISNNHKKQLLRLEVLNDVLFQDDNGDLVVDVAAYEELKTRLQATPIEDIVGASELDFNSEYFMFC